MAFVSIGQKYGFVSAGDEFRKEIAEARAEAQAKAKAEEQALFTDIQTYFDQAKGASEAFPGLKIRMKAMEKKFFELQSVSTKIQEMVYKPFIQRIKDYLLGLAAVAILLMFLNLLSAKIKTLKQAREQAKKMKEMMDGQHNYPTI